MVEQEQPDDDLVWVEQTLAGDKDAFAHLFERYQRLVYTHAYYRLNNPSDAQDAVQEVFRRAYLRLETFDTTRQFRSWLMTIATNYCTDVLRRRISLKRFAPHVSLDAVDFWVADTDANPEGAIQANEQREVVRQAVRKLPDKYREVVILFYWNDLSYSEISDVTGLPESTIKTRLHRARERLIGLLDNQQTSQ